jgi:hypothetical protein
MDRAQLDAAYNNSAAVPERDAIVADWAERSRDWDLGHSERVAATRAISTSPHAPSPTLAAETHVSTVRFCSSARRGTSDAAAVASDFGLRDLRRD